jgi:deferrochelatase/peroxidase EfeB
MSPLDRRAFLTRSAALLGAGGVGGVAAIARAAGEQERVAPAATTPTTAEEWNVAQAQLARQEPFDGSHQAGILTPAPAQATFAALDSLAPDRETLAEALRALSRRARELTAGGATPLLEADDPPADSGILGPVNAPDVLTVTIAFGASLFDGRYGLAGQRPRELVNMPTFAIDDLEPAQSHGDLLLQICAHQRDTVVHTLRELLRTVRGALQLRWNIDGFSGAARGPSPHNSPRNLFAFRDGTANPPTNTRGFDAAGQLDQGLVFVAFNQSPERQFATIQRRLIAEPMIDYITPVGGGYFFAPPGARGGDDWVGSGLFASV